MYNSIVEMYKNIIKPILFLLTPDFTHKLTIDTIQSKVNKLPTDMSMPLSIRSFKFKGSCHRDGTMSVSISLYNPITLTLYDFSMFLTL